MILKIHIFDINRIVCNNLMIGFFSVIFVFDGAFTCNSINVESFPFERPNNMVWNFNVKLVAFHNVFFLFFLSRILFLLPIRERLSVQLQSNLLFEFSFIFFGVRSKMNQSNKNEKASLHLITDIYLTKKREREICIFMH